MIGIGFGQEMSKILQDKGATAITLHVKSDNLPAVQFYKTKNFQVAQKLSQHYLIKGKRYDALYLQKSTTHEDEDSRWFFQRLRYNPIGWIYEWLTYFLNNYFKQPDRINQLRET